MAVTTNLILPVAAAEPVVAVNRARLDPSAVRGMPAHISVLVPFLELDAVGSRELRDLEALFAAVAPIEFRLARVARFPNALYLVPDPAAPFVALTEAVWRRWPGHPPYEGEFDDIVPHLTVAVGEGPFDHLVPALGNAVADRHDGHRGVADRRRPSGHVDPAVQLPAPRSRCVTASRSHQRG